MTSAEDNVICYLDAIADATGQREQATSVGAWMAGLAPQPSRAALIVASDLVMRQIERIIATGFDAMGRVWTWDEYEAAVEMLGTLGRLMTSARRAAV